jgi:sulfatase maturation enzyme AslB (radical SAM superfamily)
MQTFLALPFQKDKDFFVIVVPYFGIAFIHNEPLGKIQLADEEVRRLLNDVEGYQRKSITKHTKPSKLAIIMTSYCEAKCTYCYARDHRLENIHIDTKSISKQLDEMGVDKIDHVLVYGGEPFYDLDKSFEVLDYLKYDLGISGIHVTTSLLYDDYKFQKVISFCEHRNIGMTVSIDPPSKNYPRVVNGIEDEYQTVLKRIHALSNTSIPVGVRATISDYAYDIYELFKDLNKYDKPISVNMEVSKGFPISDEAISTCLTNWISHSTEVIERLYGKTYGNIFDRTFTHLTRYKNANLLNLFKNCDAGRGRISLTPNGKRVLCSEDVLGETVDKEATYENIFPYDDRCNRCHFKYTCGYLCFIYNDKYRDIACNFHIALFLEGFKQFVNYTSKNRLVEWVENQPIKFEGV